ncbi:flagellar assembly protein FliH [Celerinatantimonas yamalensis]|uniref:Flagellar assembly protein FliH n=1 Tax=Celerinatantimonas yamalensis TaxID=559956 RepID=A0ABW9G6V4_9GAMM
MVDHIKDDDIAKLRDVSAEDYDLPDFGKPIHKAATNALNRPFDWYQDESEPQNRMKEEEVRPLTIDDIESIRQVAYDEGVTEGRAVGTAQGIEEGREKGQAEGYEHGFQQGLKEGLSQGQQQIDTLSGYWLKLLDELVVPVQQVTAQVQLQLVDLICDVARAVIQSELTTNKQVIIHTVKEAVQAMPVTNQTLLIHLHPDDLMIIESVYPKQTQQKKNWQLLEDGSLPRGDCMIEAENSTIDYSMQNVIEQALKRFKAENNEHARQVAPTELPEFESSTSTSQQSESDSVADDAVERVEPNADEHDDASHLNQQHNIGDDDGVESDPQ